MCSYVLTQNHKIQSNFDNKAHYLLKELNLDFKKAH